jgi:hypothetical protein
MTIWYILCPFGTFFSGFGVMYQENSGNPGVDGNNWAAFQHSTTTKPFLLKFRDNSNDDKNVFATDAFLKMCTAFELISQMTWARCYDHCLHV